MFVLEGAMRAVNVVQESKIDVNIAVVALGYGISKITVDIMSAKKGNSVGCYYYQDGMLNSDNTLNKMFDSDLIFVIIDNPDCIGNYIDFIEQISNRGEKLVICVFVGQEISFYKFHIEQMESICKAFYIPDRDNVEKYIIQFIRKIERTFGTESVVRLDLDDLKYTLTGKRNFFWMGKGYGKNKVQNIVSNFMTDTENIYSQFTNKKVILILDGEVSLSDLDAIVTAVDPASEVNGLIVSAIVDTEAYEDLSVLLIYSTDEKFEC